MIDWYESKLSYETANENGEQTKITENYLVAAVNVSEAEAILTKEIASNLTDDFKVENVKSEKIYEIFYKKNCEGECQFFKSKIAFIVVDEEKGKEKRVNSTIYVQSETIDSALKDLRLNLKDTTWDYEIVSVTKSKIVDAINLNN